MTITTTITTKKKPSASHINRQIRLASTPQQRPQANNFELVEAALPNIEPNQVLCATQFLSLDPYMRSQIAGRHLSGSIAPGDLMRGETVSRVVRSNCPGFKPGDWVTCFGDWQEYSCHTADKLRLMDPRINPPSYALSSLGMPGLTAYAGLVKIAKAKAGEVLLLPAAIGAVGSTVGQLAKSIGCAVVGITSSEEKCRIAIEELGYDHCINRNASDLAQQLKTHCPDGVDIYFDLVGGETLNTVCMQLALNARVILCGLMEDYNKTTRTPGPMPGPIIGARATLSGLVVYDWEAHRSEFVDYCLPLLETGQLKVREDMAEGIHRAPEAFCRLMRGENQGKAMVKVAADYRV